MYGVIGAANSIEPIRNFVVNPKFLLVLHWWSNDFDHINIVYKPNAVKVHCIIMFQSCWLFRIWIVLSNTGATIDTDCHAHIYGDGNTYWSLHINNLHLTSAMGIVYWDQLNKSKIGTSAPFLVYAFQLLNGHRSRWMRIYGLVLGIVTQVMQLFRLLVWILNCIWISEICADTTAPSILLRFMHINIFKIVKLLQSYTNSNKLHHNTFIHSISQYSNVLFWFGSFNRLAAN